VVGAGWNGARAFTPTSGPGISLMSEFIGLAYFAEIPVTLVNVGCLQSVGQGAVVDAGNALPGPTATTLRGTIEIVP